MKLKDEIVLEDSKCMVKGCYSRFGISAHHIRNKAQGGKDVAENMITLCQLHHQIADNGGKLDGVWVPKYQFMDEVLDYYKNKKGWGGYRWEAAHKWVKKQRGKQEFKLSQRGGKKCQR